MHNELTELERLEMDIMACTGRKSTLFKKISAGTQGFVMLKLPKKLQQEILKDLSQKEIIRFLHYLDLEASSEIIKSVDKKRRTLIAEELGDEIKDKLTLLSKMSDSHVEKLMDLNYIEIDKSTPKETVSKVISRYEEKTGRFPTILIVEDGKLLGSLPGHALVLNKVNDGYETHIRTLPTVKYSDGPKEIIKAFKDHPYDKIVVLDDDDSILGVIYSDEVIGLIEKQTARNLYEFAGLNQSEDIDDSIRVKVKFRYKWLIINLFTAFMAAGVISMFDATISSYVLLAAYMPIVAGMGGNAATQTLAVVVRGLAVNDLTLKDLFRIARKEVCAGFINGLITATILVAVAYLVSGHDIKLGLVAGAGVLFNLVIAGFFGTVVPYIMMKLGKDPASSATIFITTATDVFGFMAFLGLAQIVFG